MKTCPLLLLVVVALVLPAVPAGASLVTGQTMLNPFFGSPGAGDYSNWTLNVPWRADGGDSRLVFDANATNSNGFFAAVGAGQDLTTDPAITGAADYDAATARLLGFDFSLSQPFVAIFGSNTGMSGYNLFFEVDVNTSGGTYRALSQDFGDPTLLSGPLSPSFAWQGGTFLGDLVSDGGVLLSEITGITYSAVMEVDPATADPNTAFVTVDNMSLSYEMSTTAVPEASEAVLIELLAAAMLLHRKPRRRAGNR